MTPNKILEKYYSKFIKNLFSFQNKNLFAIINE